MSVIPRRRLPRLLPLQRIGLLAGIFAGLQHGRGQRRWRGLDYIQGPGL
jgi:hypothetical protein